MRNALPLALAIGILGATIASVACSSSSTHPPISGNGASGGGSGTGTGTGSDLDGGLGTADGGLCIAGTFDVDLDTALGDVNEIAGTVQFSATVLAGHSVVLTLGSLAGNDASVPGTINFSNTFTFTTQRDDFSFRLRSLPAGTYTLQAQADITGGADVNEAGDLDGYYGGSTLAPIHTRADGATITVPGCQSGADFGIGPKM